MRRHNIAFSGLTAAGKTTHTKILADQLGYRHVSAMEIFLNIMNITEATEQAWFSKQKEIEAERDNDKIDLDVDAKLKEIADGQDGLVLDAVAMGNIYDGPLIRIWLESDEASRTRKCYVSQGDNTTLDLNGCRRHLEEKDQYTRSAFTRLYSFDYFKDMEKYDAIICNTTLIPEATLSSSQAGIDTFAPVVKDVVQYLIDAANGQASVSADSILQKHSFYILKLNEKPWSI